MTTDEAMNYILDSDEPLARQAYWVSAFYYLYAHEAWPTRDELRAYLATMHPMNFWMSELERRAHHG